MSDESKIPNEQELWDVLSSPVETTEEKKPTTPKAAPKAEKIHRKIDGFFLGCMAGVAAASVALTLAVTSMVGGGSGNGSVAVPGNNPNPVNPGVVSGEASSVDNEELMNLMAENEQLRTKIQLQQKTILELQNSLMDIMGTEEFMENMETNPDSSNEILDKQTRAYELLKQIQDAYADFDREKLEELIPEMDTMLEYLSQDALNNYYLILEYMEQPSLG